MHIVGEAGNQLKGRGTILACTSYLCHHQTWFPAEGRGGTRRQNREGRQCHRRRCQLHSMTSRFWACIMLTFSVKPLSLALVPITLWWQERKITSICLWQQGSGERTSRREKKGLTENKNEFMFYAKPSMYYRRKGNQIHGHVFKQAAADASLQWWRWWRWWRCCPGKVKGKRIDRKDLRQSYKERKGSRLSHSSTQ